MRSFSVYPVTLFILFTSLDPFFYICLLEGTDEDFNLILRVCDSLKNHSPQISPPSQLQPDEDHGSDAHSLSKPSILKRQTYMNKSISGKQNGKNVVDCGPSEVKYDLAARVLEQIYKHEKPRQRRSAEDSVPCNTRRTSTTIDVHANAGLSKSSHTIDSVAAEDNDIDVSLHEVLYALLLLSGRAQPG